MIRRPPRSTLSSSSAASDVYKRQKQQCSRILSEIRTLTTVSWEREQDDAVKHTAQTTRRSSPAGNESICSPAVTPDAPVQAGQRIAGSDSSSSSSSSSTASTTGPLPQSTTGTGLNLRCCLQLQMLCDTQLHHSEAAQPAQSAADSSSVVMPACCCLSSRSSML